MNRHLFELVEFQKSTRRTLKDQLKSLRKTAKKARKGDVERLPAADARSELNQALELLALHANTAATRESGEVRASTDLEVDGEVLLADVSPRLLLQLRKPLKRLRKAAREIQKLHPDPEVSAVAARAERLRNAIDRAIERANALEVEDQQISETLLGYLRGGG